MTNAEYINYLNQLIAQNLKKFRVCGNKTQAEIAEYLGTSPQQYQKYETNLNRISAANLARMALFYDVFIEDFFKDEDRIICQ